jgi:hypothetical protein
MIFRYFPLPSARPSDGRQVVDSTPDSTFRHFRWLFFHLASFLLPRQAGKPGSGITQQ